MGNGDRGNAVRNLGVLPASGLVVGNYRHDRGRDLTAEVDLH